MKQTASNASVIIHTGTLGHIEVYSLLSLLTVFVNLSFIPPLLVLSSSVRIVA